MTRTHASFWRTRALFTRIGNEFELSKPARKIVSTFTVAKGPKDSVDIRVDYPEVFVVMPFSEPWSDDVFTKMFKLGIEDAGFAVSPAGARGALVGFAHHRRSLLEGGLFNRPGDAFVPLTWEAINVFCGD